MMFAQYNANSAPGNLQGSEMELRGTKGTMYIHGNRWEVVPEKVTDKISYARTPLDRESEKSYNPSRKPAMDAKKMSGSQDTAFHARNFLDCVKSRAKCNCDIEIGHRSTSATLIANIAHRTKTYLEWDAKAERFTNHEAANKHPTNETIISKATRTLAETTAFVKEKRFITAYDEPLEIVPTPEFQRGVAVASCSPAGPLEKNKKTFYYISPTPEDWTPERVESFFREYNDSMLQELTIHEAMPGHYLQLAHANRFRAPTLVRAVVFSGTFVEGWATYAEQLMADAGYGGAEVRMQQLKMRLRMILNAIIDQKIHTEGMSEEEAIARMKNDAFQEEGEAVGKWKRARLSSTQLSTYYVGNAEMNDIRAAWEKNHGKYPDLRSLHDAMLSFGNAAPKYVKERLGM